MCEQLSITLREVVNIIGFVSLFERKNKEKSDSRPFSHLAARLSSALALIPDNQLFYQLNKRKEGGSVM